MKEGPIRVLYVDHESRLSGGQQDLLDLVRALGPRVEAHVTLPAEGPLAAALREVGAQVHLVPMSLEMLQLSRWDIRRKPWILLKFPITALRASLRIAKLIREVKPDVVHTNSMKAHFLAGIPGRLAGVPLVWHIRDILNQGWLRRIFGVAAWRIPTIVVCISSAVMSQFSGTRAYHRARVVYNGIDIHRFRGVPSQDLRAKVGASGDQLLVGIVGQIAWWKGQDLFIEAARMTRESDPGMKFVIVGECLFPENEGNYEKSLHQRVEELELEDRLTFLGWVDEPEQAMASMDLVVHASRLPEPFGRVIVEGMAAGKPVIASSTGAGPELLSDSEGRVIDPSNPRVLADTLLALASDRSRLGILGEAARRRAADFDISRTAEGVLSVYRDLGVESQTVR